MNPITSQNNFMAMYNAIRSGQIDPKTEVLNRLGCMSPARKEQIKKQMPLLKTFANKLGIDIGEFENEIGAHL